MHCPGEPDSTVRALKLSRAFLGSGKKSFVSGRSLASPSMDHGIHSNHVTCLAQGQPPLGRKPWEIELKVYLVPRTETEQKESQRVRAFSFSLPVSVGMRHVNIGKDLEPLLGLPVCSRHRDTSFTLLDQVHQRDQRRRGWWTLSARRAPPHCTSLLDRHEAMEGHRGTGLGEPGAVACPPSSVLLCDWDCPV